MSTTKTDRRKTLGDFEQAHGQPKIKALEKRLAVERAKVEALADVQNIVIVERRKDCELRFALLGDTQFGSLYAHLDALGAFYRHAESCGYTDFYHTGDVLDGHKVYKGQEFELLDLGIEAQIDRMAAVAPKIGTTRFITGNHDASFKALAGVPVGKMIESRRPDWQFLGEEHARIQWETPAGTFALGLSHPGGGSAYAISYRGQKIVESLEGGTKPDMLALGHFHKAEFMPSYRNVAVIQTGAFQRQTPFMARMGLAAHVGGWLVDVTVGEGHNRIRAEFVAFYV